MRQAAVIGIGKDEFWTMTPRWLLPLLSAHQEARIGRMRFEVSLEYLGVYWATRAKRMPTIDRALKDLGLGLDIDEPRGQTPEEMYAAAARWAERVNKAAAANGATPKSTKRARLPSLDRWRAAQGKAAGEQ